MEVAHNGTLTKYPHPDVREVGTSRVCYPHRDALSTIGLVTNTVGAVGLRQRF